MDRSGIQTKLNFESHLFQVTIFIFTKIKFTSSPLINLDKSISLPLCFLLVPFRQNQISGGVGNMEWVSL
jgi:hypothetical protein